MNWKQFLTDVSKTLLDNNDDIEDDVKESASNNWLGYSPASKNDILELETRLNLKLPPSYKKFLQTSNGFKQLDCFIWNILPTSKVDWLKNFDDYFYSMYAATSENFTVSDAEYYIYGEKQNLLKYRHEYLVNSIAISGWGDAAILLLNPQVKFGEEWEAWMYASWYPGVARYKSFEELMVTKYSSYLNLLNDKD